APGQLSYRTEVAGFFNKKYDAVLWQLTDVTAAAFFESGHRLGKLQGNDSIGTDAALAEATLEILKPYIADATFVAVSPAESGPGREKFVELYDKYLDGVPVVLSDIGYDATTVLLLAIEAAQSTEPGDINAKVRAVATPPGTECLWFGECADLLRNGKEINFNGAASSLAFNEGHNVIVPFALATISSDGSIEGRGDVAFTVKEITETMQRIKEK